MTNVISRQVLDLWNKYKPTIAVDAIEYDRKLKKLLSTNLASLGTDCISREQAIDAVNSVMVMKGIRSGKSVTAEAVDCAKRIIADNIRQLQPIQLEIVRCKDCQHYEYGICKKAGLCVNKSPNGFCDWAERREVTEWAI